MSEILCAERDCGQPFTPRKPTSRFCSRLCANRGISRETAEKRGDTLRGRGAGTTLYRKRGGKHEHRTVAEQMLGRPLKPGEVVHHRDHDKRNNDPSNLEVLASQAEHAAGHGHPCVAGCSCGRHRSYVRTPEYRERMSAALSAAWAKKKGQAA